MDFHAVKTSAHGVGCALAVLLHHFFDFFLAQGVWHGGGHFAVAAIGHDFGCHRRGCDRFSAAGQVGVRDAAHMPDLRNDFSARRVHGLGDGLPAFDLRVRVNAGCGHIAFAPGRDLGAFADDQARVAALAVVLDVHGAAGDVASGLVGAATGQWGHDHAVGHLDVADAGGLEELGKGVGHVWLS